MAEHDVIAVGAIDDPVLGTVRYCVTQTVNAICPSCGNPDCAEIEEFKERHSAESLIGRAREKESEK